MTACNTETTEMNHDHINLQRLTTRLEARLVELNQEKGDEGYWQIEKTLSVSEFALPKRHLICALSHVRLIERPVWTSTT